jgi:hypothetical protein
VLAQPYNTFQHVVVCCVVLRRHSFVSAYDFGPWPLLEGVTQLPAPVTQVCTPALCDNSVHSQAACHFALCVL